LILSDNPELTVFFQEQIRETLFKHVVQIDFCYSSINKNPETMIAVGSKEINVKLPQTIESLVGYYDLILSAHCKQIFPRDLVASVSCINFHPGYNPYNRGWFPQVFSILNGYPVGVTIHCMDEEIDHGHVIAQEIVDISIEDTSLEVYRKIISVEKKLIQKHLLSIIEGTFVAVPPSMEGNYNGIQDYKNLCQLDLNQVATLREHINLLRATSHGSYKNAYFLDEDGSKYFVCISIERESESNE